MVLLVHPTNASWYNTYSPPKGEIENEEDTKEAAIRETYEEVGILIDKSKLKDFVEIDYVNKNKELYKKVYLYPVFIDSLIQIKLNSLVVPAIQLQLEEVDDARFFCDYELDKRCYFRFIPELKRLLNFVK